MKVYVWGLNDKDQLGGQKGSKVCVRLVRLLFILLELFRYELSIEQFLTVKSLNKAT